MKRIVPIVVILAMVASFLQLASFSPGVKASPGVEAICVPCVSSVPTIPHYTYTGAQTTLKGIARGDAIEYRWDFGDGGGTSWAAIGDPYNLGVQHAYTGIVGQLFLATLSVKDGSGNTDQDTYRVKIFESSELCEPAQLDVRIAMAIDEGLWWLHTSMIRGTYGPGSPGYDQPYGYWDPWYYPVASTGTSVDAFQLNGHGVSGDFANDPYVETVQRAFNYLLGNTYAYPIGVQPAGNPDTNGNGIGLVTNQSNYLYDGRQTYIGGICMTAFASSGSPGRVAPVGYDGVYGRTFADIVQDMVDFFAWGQSDPDTGWARGGWRYFANYGNSDMSTTQWPPLGMLAAELNMGATVPQFVRDELIYFLDYTQNIDLSEANGCFGYDGPWSMLNITKAAAGIISHEFLGTPLTDPKVEKAIGYIYRHWGDTGTGWDDTQLLGNSYGMYGVMKAFRIPDPDTARVTEYDYTSGGQTANSFDWYYTPCGQTQEGLASYIVGTQQADGSWDDTVGPNAVIDAFCTGWRILTLLPPTTIAPVAVICDSDEQEYNLNQDIHLDGSCSYHPLPTRHIVLHEWDFDCDGTIDATGPTATIVGGYAAEGYYCVELTVTDDNPEAPQTGTTSCEIYVHPPPHCPHAFSGGPYIGWVNVPVVFDASMSWDPDNEIVLYEWDLDGDGEFDDGLGINSQWTWDSPYFGVIGLRVTDAEGPYPACSDVDYTTVEIGNHHPIADAGGPYLALRDTCITVDGTKSSDPDPGDGITYAWDLDGDGQFDDCTEPTCEFCVGAEIGVRDIGLRVTDSFGLQDTAYTTVEVFDALAVDDAYSTNENTVLDVSAPGVLTNDTDADGDTLTAILVSDVGHGTLTLNPDGSFTYTPAADYVGSDSFCYKANGGEGDSNVATVTITVLEARVSAAIDFDPDTLNLGSKGKVVTVYIELPTGYDVGQIDISSIRLNGTVPALAKPTAIGDYDKDGIPDLMVKFDRAAVEKILAPGDQVEITIEGKVAGVDFEGSDTIRVIAKGKVATAGVSNIPYLGYILAGLAGCFVIAAGLLTFFMWGRPLPNRN